MHAIGRAALSEYWSRAALQNALTHGYELRICRRQGRIIAYLLSQDIVDETHIMQLAVDPAYRRQGMATALTRRLLEDKQHMHALCLEVRASNVAAQTLYTGFGFVRTGTRKNYYVARNGMPGEDAVLMQYLPARC